MATTHKTVFHRDGSITFWDTRKKQWVGIQAHQVAYLSDATLALLPEADRKRIQMWFQREKEDTHG